VPVSAGVTASAGNGSVAKAVTAARPVDPLTAATVMRRAAISTATVGGAGARTEDLIRRT
jgi:hypothetical protein